MSDLIPFGKYRGQEITHVAAPVAEGRCCDLCHTKHVEPARIMRRMLGLPPVENEGGSGNAA